MKEQCRVSGCQKPSWARGACGLHYQWWRKTGDFEPSRTAFTALCAESPGENWLPVVAFERYMVSDQGRVWSFCGKGRILVPGLTPKGRPIVRLNKTWQGVGRLVLTAFVGPCPEGMECCHENDRPTDNRLSNLRWDTHIANEADKLRNGNSARGTRNPHSKLTERDIPAIKEMVAAGMSHAKVAAEFGISRPTVTAIIAQRNWGWVA